MGYQQDTKHHFQFHHELIYWENVVKYYSGTALTVEADRLLAASGMAKSVQQQIDRKYVAGP